MAGRSALPDGQPIHSASSALTTTIDATQTEEFGHDENVPNDGLSAVFSELGLPKRTLNLMSDEERTDTKDQILKLTKELVVKRAGQNSTPPSSGLGHEVTGSHGHRKVHGASMDTAEEPIKPIETGETKFGQSRMAPSSWYKRGGHLNKDVKKHTMLGHPKDDGFGRYSNAKRADGGLKDGLKKIPMSEAGSALMEHQGRVGGIPFIEEHGDSYRLITNKNGRAVSLHPGAWRALNGYEHACISKMRNSHKPMGSGQGSTAKGNGDRSKKENTRWRKINIEADPEEIELKDAGLSAHASSLLPAVKDMPSSKLSEMA